MFNFCMSYMCLYLIQMNHSAVTQTFATRIGFRWFYLCCAAECFLILVSPSRVSFAGFEVCCTLMVSEQLLLT